jgi:hypothetical protein
MCAGEQISREIESGQSLVEGGSQGDQIGRIFAQWAIVYIGQFLKNYRSSAKFWASFFLSIDYVFIFTKKMGWAASWAKFSQTHLVTDSVLMCVEALHVCTYVGVEILLSQKQF